MAIIVVPIILTLDLARTERVILVLVTVLVLLVELLNSAIEAVVDRVGPEHHELSGRAKDMGAGAVLVSLILWVYVWCEIVVFGQWLSVGI